MTGPDEPVVNAVYLTATDGNEDKLQDVLLETVGAALAAPGNHGFSILKSTEKPANFLVVERWANSQAIQAETRPSVLTGALARVADRKLVATGPSGSKWTRII